MSCSILSPRTITCVPVATSPRIVSVAHFTRFARSAHLLPAREIAKQQRRVSASYHCSLPFVLNKYTKERVALTFYHNWRRWELLFSVLQILRAHHELVCVANLVAHSGIRMKMTGERLLSLFFFLNIFA